MRRMSVLAIAAALGSALFASTPANAVGVSTCVFAAGVTAGPHGATVDYLYVGSVNDCLN
jgi:hypothetical protein